MTSGSAKRAPKTKPAPIELINPGTSGVVYNEAGQSVGGGDRVQLAGEPDAVAMRQLEVGHLLAQRGDAWLTVRDGQLVDPAADSNAQVDGGTAGSGEQNTAVGASTTNDASRAETIRPNE